MKRQGRPTVFTEITLKKIEEAFCFGCTDKEACVYADVSLASLYNYQNKHQEFADRKIVLKANPLLKARMCVVDELSKNPQLAFKYLEKYLEQEVIEKYKPNIPTQESTVHKTMNTKELIERTKDALDAIEGKGKYKLIGGLNSSKIYTYNDLLNLTSENEHNIK